jgi:predicted ATP-binding protein involved in virulence
MRIDELEIENFKKFEKQNFDLHPHFTLLMGENGSGKTSVLDALSVAAGIWLVEKPDSTLYNSGRNILQTEIRLEPEKKGDRVQFRERRPVLVRARGRIGDHEDVHWARQIRRDSRSKRTYNAEAKEALMHVKEIYARDSAGESVLCPVLAYYGAGRAWLSSNERVPKPKTNGPARRWAAFYDCFNERIRFAELQKWFSRETTERGNRGGKWRPGFDVVRRAVLRCVPDADGIWFDADRDQVVLSISGNAQPFDNLSAGQRMMLALVSDLAIKAVTQNAFLLPPDELGPQDEPVPKVLRETPGVVLIDELDVHLHPRWQRRVATDLKTTFPAIQFVCTSHSPQVIGEVTRDEVRSLKQHGGEHRVERPSVARGADSNWILDHVMEGAASKTPEIKTLQDEAEDALAEGSLPVARAKLEQLRALLDGDTGELVRLESSLESLEALAEEAAKGSAPSENH